MKTKQQKMLLLILSLILPHLASCQEEPTMKFSVLVVDNEGKPIPNCEAGAIIFKDKKFQRSAKMTDKHGIAYYELKTPNSRLATGAKAPEGYYRTLGEEFFYDPPKSGIWQPENKQFKVVLKKKKNPIPMYAVFAGMNSKLEIPEFDKPFGFDLEIADWVAPHGKGKISDLIFQLSKEERSKKDYDATLTITFSNPGDGLIGIKVPAEGNQKSKLLLPYKAPEEGYESKIVKSTHAKPGQEMILGYNKNQHYFLRVRTKLSDSGHVMSALYGKIHSDINFWDNGVFRFIYYLNPTPNDKNIEFDTKKNLFKVERGGVEVQLP